MKLTSLQIAALEYYHRKTIGLTNGMLVRQPQLRVFRNVIKKGLIDGGKLTPEGLAALIRYKPQYKDERKDESTNIVKMADHDSDKGWEIHRATETVALAVNIEQLIRFYGAEAVEWQIRRITRKVA